jgi:hypothetical protein
MPAGHLPSPPMEAARLFPEPAAGEPYTILIMAAIGDAWLYGTPRWVLAQTRQEACDRLETTVMRPSGTRENKQTNNTMHLVNIATNSVSVLQLSISVMQLYISVMQHSISVMQLSISVMQNFRPWISLFIST